VEHPGDVRVRGGELLPARAALRKAWPSPGRACDAGPSRPRRGEPMNIADRARTRLRSQGAWGRFRRPQPEGLVRAVSRSRVERRILDTAPVPTPSTGAVEVRVLTWRRDCLSAIWALKTFFHTAGRTFPLFIHDGGLAPGQAATLQRHFPNAT